MIRTALYICCTCLGVLLSSVVWGQEYPDAYEEPTLNPSALGQGVEEFIDPYSGSLRLVVTDIIIPGPAGFDLKVMRHYKSPSKILPAQGTILNASWGIATFGALLGGTQNCGSGNDSRDNPVFFTPDGRRMLFSPNSSVPGQAPGVPGNRFISKERWRAICYHYDLTDNNFDADAWVIHTPQGIQFSLTKKTDTGTAYSTDIISDPNGNAITINRGHPDLKQRITSVTSSDGKVLRFVYSSNEATGKLIEIIDESDDDPVNHRSWHYCYDNNGGKLTKVVLPDDSWGPGTNCDNHTGHWKWEYQYHGDSGSDACKNCLKEAHTPYGGRTEYAYKEQDMYPGIDGSGKRIVVERKTVRNTGDLVVLGSGDWLYTYEPGGNSGELDQTTVEYPGGKTVYHHIGYQVVESDAEDNLWTTGLLDQKEIYDGSFRFPVVDPKI